MFNILLMPVAVVVFWQGSLIGMLLYIINDLMEIRAEIQKEIKEEKDSAEYNRLMEKYRK